MGLFVRFCGVLLLGSASTANAQDPWDETEFVRRVVAGSSDVVAARARHDRAEAARAGVGLLENPSIAFERQETFDANAQSQDIVRLILPIDLSSRRRARRDLAEVSASMTEAESIAAQDDSIEQALSVFYAAIAADLRSQARAEAVTGLEEAVRVMRQREAAGAASGYESSRLTVALEVARSEHAQAEVEAAALREMLGALAGSAAPSALVGDLDVAAPESADALVQRAGGRADLHALSDAVHAAEHAQDGARRAGFPRLEVSAGYNRQRGPQIGHGYLVGAQLEVPLFSRGQGERSEANAAAESVAAERDALTMHIHAHILAEHTRLVGLLAERARFANATVEPLADLLRATESGYREGVRSVVEMLDARQAAVAVREREISLALAARLSDVRLRRAVGTLR